MKKIVTSLALFALAALCASAYALGVPDLLHQVAQQADSLSALQLLAVGMTTLAANAPRSFELGSRNQDRKSVV